MADSGSEQPDFGNDFNFAENLNPLSGAVGTIQESDASGHSDSAPSVSPAHSDTHSGHSSITSAADHLIGPSLEVSWAAGTSGDGTNVSFSSTAIIGNSDTESKFGSISSAGSSRATMLPWGAQKERSPHQAFNMDSEIRPGEFVMRTLFADFTVQAERKMEAVMAEPMEKPLSKVLQRGEDPQFDQLLSAFGCVAEHCLPSLLRALFAWYERQMAEGSAIEQKKVDQKGKSIMYIVSGGSATETVERSDADIQQERRDLAVEFIFCLVLIEVLKQLSFHPGHDDLVGYIENLAFKHFKYRDGIQSGPNAPNIHIIADLYAEVIGVLAQSRFMPVRKRFMTELKELRSKELNAHTTQSIISLLMGMKFFRVKMVPIEEFEASFQFMQEAAQYFLDVKDKDIKHALAGLFVEILVPVAASVKNEVNVPCLKNFVEMLYSQTLDASTKNKHRLALFPLVTCLLCVSQKTFFLQNWHYFLAMCLSHLKNRDTKMSRVALESLYRLLWVYMIRIKCESNSATQSRLQSICNSLFPKGSKSVVPRDTPLNIFVKIIQFIAQERLDYAMREIVFDLLSVGRPVKIILTPERLSIGLRAFLVVADSLQQKEGEPPMPRTVGVLPSGNTLRVKKTFLNKVLTDDMARSIGMSTYFTHVRRTFADILRALDLHYGRPLMIYATQNISKEPDELVTGERKPRIDLYRTCVAAIPRLIPDGMPALELIDNLARLTGHVDEELRALAFQSLQTLVIDFPDWRQDVVWGFVTFLNRDILDTFPQLIDNGLRMLLQLLTSWKNAITSTNSTRLTKDSNMESGRTIRDYGNMKQVDHTQKVESLSSVLHFAEAFALVMLCNCRLSPRRLAVHILRDIKLLMKALNLVEDDQPVIDVIDKCCPEVMENIIPILPPSEKSAALSVFSIDLQWIAERSSCVWTAGFHDESNTKSSSTLNLCGSDPWTMCLFSFLDRGRVLTYCPSTVMHSWPIVWGRVNSLYSVVDPMPVNDNRASLLRSSTTVRKPNNEREIYLHVWKNYIAFAFRVVPPIPSPVIRCASPDISLSSLPMESGGTDLTGTLSQSLESLDQVPSIQGFVSSGRFTLPLSAIRRHHKRNSSSPDSMGAERNENKPPGTNISSIALYKLIVPLLRCETIDVRDAAVYAIGKINTDALKDLMEELVPYIRDAVDRKTENVRRRKRRDTLRIQLIRTLEFIAEQGTFSSSPYVLDRDTQQLQPQFTEYMDGARNFLESEPDKDSPVVKDITLHFCHFVTKMIKSFSLETRATLLKRDLRRSLFTLFAASSGAYSKPLRLSSTVEAESSVELQLAALQATSALLCCGPCFNPQGLAEDGLLYPWLDMLLASKNEKIYGIACETVVLLLECNPDIGTLLDWVVDRCYTGSPQVADGCFLALATIFSAREYPCDHYTAVINVTLMNTGCPRTLVHDTALQLLQVLDKRFFGNVGPLSTDGDTTGNGDAKGRSTLDVLLSTTYCRSQMYLSRQLAQLHPELTMPMFSEITHRFQTARPEVRQLLLQYLLPWLHNMELVDPNVPSANPLSYFQYYASEMSRAGSRREGWGSAEATEMVLNNLFYITAKFSDEHPKEMEDLWATLCACWPNNLKIIIRYLIIISGMAPQELLPYAKRVVLYLARSRPDRLLDEMMTELQTVETLNCLIERTETPPFYRLTSMRKASSHSDGTGAGPGAADSASRAELAVEKGTIHTKRHSGEDPIKTGKLKDLFPKSQTTDISLNTSKQSSPLMFLSYGDLHNATNDNFPISKSLCGKSKEFTTCPKVITSKSDTALRALAGFAPTRTEKTRTASGPPMVCDDILSPPNIDHELLQPQDDMYCMSRMPGAADKFDMSIPQPHPLPMPEYGGYFAPLTEYLPECSQPISGFHRCNVAVMLLTDVVTDGIEVDWSVHVPLILHMVLVGMDHTRPLVHEHCRRLLLGLLIVVADHCDHLTVAHTLLNCNTALRKLKLSIPSLPVVDHIFTEPDPEFDSYLQGPVPPTAVSVAPASSSSTLVASSTAADSEPEQSETVNPVPPVIVTQDGNTTAKGPEPGPNMPIQDVTKSLISFLAKQNQPLWIYEDITAKVWSIRSAEQLDVFLQHILRVFHESLPHALINERWAQTALQLGLSCSSRHYAGRSLQVFRSLRVPISSRMLSDILSRLVETVAEQGEDMQGYVTELLLTLEAAVDSLESDFRPLDFMKEIFKSTPNLNNKEPVNGPVNLKRNQGNMYPGAMGMPHTPHLNQAGHMRSTSYSVSYCMRKTGPPANEHKDVRNRVEMEQRNACNYNINKYCSNLSRSRSAQSLKLLGDSATQDDKMTILAQLFWLSVSLLESDYEHEFLLALRLLSRVLHKLPLDRPDARDKVDKLQSQLRWASFPGVHALLLKGCTNPNTYEPVVTLLSQFTLLLDLVVVDPSQNLAFPMNVIALLPYMILNYEDANELCIRSAENIAQASAEKSKKLENLGTVMTLYSRRNFSKESFQWTKCVVKYLYDTYSHLSFNMLAFLIEVLEKGPSIIQLPVLSIIHCMLHYVDLASPAAQPINADLLRVIAKYLDGQNWKEALKILKLVVTRSSSLVAPPISIHPPHWESSISSSPHPSFADSEIFAKKELPGRTMEFTFDLSQTPVIGRRFLVKTEDKKLAPGPIASPRRSVSLSPADATTVAGWKRPWMSQGRVRECLVNLLTTCGQRVGLPKSPSVIFSQSSDLMERQSSMASSTEEVSGTNNDLSGGSRRDEANTEQFGVFKDFDFLEYESESVEGESTDNFNWGVRRRPLSDGDPDHPSLLLLEESLSEKTPILSKRKKTGADESSDDELESESPLDEIPGAPDFGNNVAAGGGAFPPSSLSLRERRTRRNSSARSDTSGSSTGDLGDVTPCNASPNLLGLMGFRPISSDDAEEAWKSHLQTLLAQIPANSLELFHQVYRLVKDVENKTIAITREACRYLNLYPLDSATHLVLKLTAATDMLAISLEPPLVWFEPDSVSNQKLTDSLRYGVLEIREHLETFFDRKDHAAEYIEAVKAAVKLESIGELHPEPGHDDLIIDLGRALYKLQFQLLLLVETAHKMATALGLAARTAALRDMSGEIRTLRAALKRAQDDGGNGERETPTPTPSPIPSLPSGADDLDGALRDLLHSERWYAALCFVRRNKNALNRDLYVTAEDDDIATVLNVYCRYLTQSKQDVFVICGGDGELADVFGKLFQVSAAVMQLENSAKEHHETHISSQGNE